VPVPLLQEVCEPSTCRMYGKVPASLILFLSELMDLFVAGQDQSAADQPNNLAEGHPSFSSNRLTIEHARTHKQHQCTRETMKQS